jgi:hypothetical protein
LNNHDIVAVSAIEYNDLPVYAGWKTPQKKIEKVYFSERIYCRIYVNACFSYSQAA